MCEKVAMEAVLRILVVKGGLQLQRDSAAGAYGGVLGLLDFVPKSVSPRVHALLASFYNRCALDVNATAWARRRHFILFCARLGLLWRDDADAVGSGVQSARARRIALHARLRRRMQVPERLRHKVSNEESAGDVQPTQTPVPSPYHSPDLCPPPFSLTPNPNPNPYPSQS
jgi:hypothetical protein